MIKVCYIYFVTRILSIVCLKIAAYDEALLLIQAMPRTFKLTQSEIL